MIDGLLLSLQLDLLKLFDPVSADRRASLGLSLNGLLPGLSCFGLLGLAKEAFLLRVRTRAENLT